MTEEEKDTLLKYVVEQFIPFNRLLEIGYVSADPISITIYNRPELVGNDFRKILHGGVIATMIDVAGGAALLKNILDRDEMGSSADMADKLGRTATIDLRIDYIRPGMGERFIATAEIIRPGKRVTVVRMELRNEENVLIAVGTGTYAV